MWGPGLRSSVIPQREYSRGVVMTSRSEEDTCDTREAHRARLIQLRKGHVSAAIKQRRWIKQESTRYLAEDKYAWL